ncbi:Transcriptional regulator GntR [Pseudomonas syringae pv. philadelphi]|uniref:Transcriptional regulator GntR n=1 Tax=Pseudomonas syringae pv. philadelphi TaxID=251706 RepID=A0A3M3YP40_9PSED|nr:hypothetical protein [Pseudomonas syringae group genomosp. 3]RMO84320.1 Transcriptional regulator GntR [Pseudomonas syringae pv. philadelphi]
MRDHARPCATMREHANATLHYAEIFGTGLHERIRVIQRAE